MCASVGNDAQRSGNEREQTPDSFGNDQNLFLYVHSSRAHRPSATVPASNPAVTQAEQRSGRFQNPRAGMENFFGERASGRSDGDFISTEHSSM